MMTQPSSTTPALKTFLAAAARRPGTIGAVAPSSPALAKLLASVVPSVGSPTVVELGPGTGSMSTAIQRRLPAGGTHIAVEIDEQLVEYLRRHHPDVDVVYGDAGELGSLLAGMGAGEVDAVVSGLPWSIFSAEKQDRILSSICEVLAPTGVFTTFGYAHASPMLGARRFHASLVKRFDEVLTSKVVWRNFPPARSVVCRRPVGHA